MLNQMVVVGRIAKELETIELDNGHKRITINLAVNRTFKNENGEYDTDFLDIALWDAIASSVTEYCKKGDLVGVKGRIQTFKENGKVYPQLIAEKVTFLSSKKEKEEE